MSEGAERRPPASVDERDDTRQGGGDRGTGEDQRDTINVRPEDVWQPRPPGSEPRWALRSFFAPILRVVVISALLLYGLLALGTALWAWLR